MKVALVCEWLTESGGAEEVIKKFHELYPDAPIYTSQYRHKRTPWLKDADVRTGYLNFFPVKSRRFIASLRQRYFKNLDLSGYDLVISITGCDAKFIKTDGHHICYCHVPTQYYWGKYDEYLKNPGFGLLNPLARLVFKKSAKKLRKNDFEAAKNPDDFITISNFAKQEIKHFYKRESKVLNPPVNWEFFSQFVENYNTKKGKSQIDNNLYKNIKINKNQVLKSEQKFFTGLENVENLDILTKILTRYPDGFYLNFSRQVNWKNLSLAIEACEYLNLPLVLVGNGPENKKLKRLAKKLDTNSSRPIITFINPLKKSDLAVLSRFAKAFIFPSEEPFGIAPIEAMSAGCPVIALKKGGALDYIKSGENGFFFDEPTVNSLKNALKKFESRSIPLDSKKISKSVEKFSSKNFDQKWEKFSKTLPKHSRNSLKASESLSDSPKFTIKKLKSFLFFSFPAVLFLSFFPSLKFGETDAMFLELSLPLIWLALFSVLSLKDVLKYLKTNLKTPLLLFPVFMTLSTFWSRNFLRGFLTAGVVWCLFISIISLTIFIKNLDLKKFSIFYDWRAKLRKIIFISAVFVCVFCIFQSILDTIGLDRNLTLLCEGCVSETFGFPHPNGFAIEPQFMGNLLLAPILLALNSLLKNKTRKSQIKAFSLSVLFIFTLFLTLSRGAILAFLAALIILIFANLKNLKEFFKNLLKLILAPLISLLLALNFQGLLAELGPTNVDYKTAIENSIEQLTLGQIKFDQSKTADSSDNIPAEEPNDSFETPEVESLEEIPIEPFRDLTAGNDVELISEKSELILEPDSPDPTFDGYIAESTDRRLELASYAIKIWSKNPTNTIFGTGLGSAGTVMLEDFPSQGIKKEIVQNQYLETLLETGLLGITFFVISLITFIKLEHLKMNVYFLALLAAYAVSLLFFSGLPNALHVYLLPIVWYNISYKRWGHSSVVRAVGS